MTLINKIIKSKRRTIALIITKEASLVVRAPFRTSLETIEKFVNKQSDWIKKKQELIAKNSIYLQPKKFIDGEGFDYEGNQYKLQIGNY